MEYMHELKEMLCEELEKIAREGELTAGSLETVDKLTHSIKSIATIMAMEDSDYSYQGGGNMGGGSSRRGGSYQGGNRGGSYARGGRGGRGGSSRQGGSYARRGGYSRDEEIDKMVEKLEKMAEKTDDPNVKQAIEQAIDTIEM